MSQLHKFRLQRLEVVDFPVEDDGDSAPLIRHRLVAALNVDDREAPMAEEPSPGGTRVAGNALAIRPATLHVFEHPTDERIRIGGVRPLFETCNATHRVQPGETNRSAIPPLHGAGQHAHPKEQETRDETKDEYEA